MGLYNARSWPAIAAEAAGGAAPAGSEGAAGPAAGPQALLPAGTKQGPPAAAPVPPPYDALLHLGDIAYDLGSLEGRRGAAFLRKAQPVAAAVPSLVAAGNHEWHANFSHFRCVERLLMLDS